MIKVLITIKTEQVTATIFPFKYILRDENEGKYQSGDCWLIQYQILRSDITRIVWRTVRRIIYEILRAEGLLNVPYYFFH